MPKQCFRLFVVMQITVDFNNEIPRFDQEINIINLIYQCTWFYHTFTNKIILTKISQRSLEDLFCFRTTFFSQRQTMITVKNIIPETFTEKFSTDPIPWNQIIDVQK